MVFTNTLLSIIVATTEALSLASCEDIQGYCPNIARKEKEGHYWVHGEIVDKQAKKKVYCDFVNNEQCECYNICIKSECYTLER